MQFHVCGHHPARSKLPGNFLFLLGSLATVLPLIAQQTQIQYLSGADKDNTVPWDFRVSAGRNAGFWTNIPVPSCWDTKGFGSYEYGNDTTSEYGEYRHYFTVPASWATQRVFLVFEGADYAVTLNNVTNAADGFQWRIQSNGWARLNYRYTLTGTQSWLGITFDYPETNVTSMRWLGQGPYRVWKNRLPGQEVAVHYKATNNTDTGKQGGYPEFRGYHGQLHWARLDTTQQPIMLATATSNLFFRVLTPPVASVSRLGVSPAFPAGNLSLLHAINAIGNKFALPDTATTGPSSANTIATGLYTGEVDFYFGELPPTGTDRDGNKLSDGWELKHFNALGQDPNADPDGDGLKLMLENAFDLSLLVPDAASPRLPRPVMPGINSPAAMGYRVPLAQLGEFRFAPEIADNLQTWFGADDHPEYFLIQSVVIGNEVEYTVERGNGWPGSATWIFLRLRIERA